MTSLPSTLRRALGVITAPRMTLEAVVADPRWAGLQALTLAVTIASGALLLQTETGRLALVDRWERTAQAFGGDVDEARYAELEAWSARGPEYAAAIGILQGPVLAFTLAGLISVFFRDSEGAARPYRQVLAVVVSAGVLLALREAVGAPLNYARETLASPLTLTALFPMFDEASPVARFLAIIDLAVLWWVIVLAIGVSVLYRRPARRLAVRFVGAYLVLAAILAIAMALSGGTV